MRPFALRTLHVAVLGILLSGLSHATAARANESKAGVTADQAIKMLTAGNARFVDRKPEHPRANAERRAETAQKGQHPFAIVLSCSDSRVPVELVFDQGIGDVFVIRVAGAVCGVNESATIEYAAEHLGSPLVVVMGHSKCGAVTAVATGAKLEGHLLELAKLIRPAVDAAQKSHPDLHGEALVPDAIKANVWQCIEEVLKKSPIMRELAKTDKVKIVGTLYDITDGKVEWLGSHPNEAKLLAVTGGAHTDATESREAEPKRESTAHTNAATPAAGHESAGATTKPAADEPRAEPAPQPKKTAVAPKQEPDAAHVSVKPRSSDATEGNDLLERCMAEELFRQGGEYLDRGQYAAAAERFRSALKMDPSLLAAMSDLAGVYYLQRDYAKAMELYNSVLARDSRHRAALRGAALVYATQKQYPQARDTLQRLLATDERDAQAWLDLGDVLFLMSDPPGAQQHWSRASAVNPTAEVVIAKARKRLQAYAP